MLVHGADPNITDNSLSTPLNVACATGASDSIDLLINYGAIFDIPSFRGNYPQHKCMYRGHTHCLEKILNYCIFIFKLFRGWFLCKECDRTNTIRINNLIGLS